MVAVLFSITAFAQDLSEGLTAKNAGNEAYRVKDYVKAIAEWEKYLNSGEEGVADDLNTLGLYNSSFKYAASDFMKNQDWASAFSYFEKFVQKGGEEAASDGKTIYYMAYCASKMNKDDVALTYYQKSIDLDYRPDMCKLYMADIYKGAGNDQKMKEILIEAIEKHPDSKSIDKMKSMLTIPILKDAAIPFNTANELAKQASTGAPADYISKMEVACAKFQEAIPLFEKVLEYDSTNEQASTYLKVCKDNITSLNDYKASIKK
jgi:tetratricopeptide (TPR) repeat protein